MTLSLVAVFVPVLFLGGLVGRLFHEFAVTIGVAIVVSGFVSLTLTPMLCSRFLKPKHEEKHNRFFEMTEGAYNRTLAFYVEGLGFAVGPRPPFDFPGAWLYAGGRPILHVVADRHLPEHRAGVLDHMAFSARDLRAVKAALERMNVRYDLRRLAGSDQWQLFCHDPSGAKVELDFDGAEAA